MKDTTMRTKALRTVAALTVASCALLAGTEKTASAQEIQLTGPLAGAPSVRKMRVYRQGRIQFEPSASFTLLDEYQRTILVGGCVNFNITDWLAIGGWIAGGVVHTTTGLTDHIEEVTNDPVTGRRGALPPDGNGEPNNYPTNISVNNLLTRSSIGSPFKNQLGTINSVISPQITLVPFRGKLAIFQKIFVDTDLYIHLGLGLTGLQERGECGGTGQKPCTDPTTFSRTSRMAVGPTFGLGINLYTGELVNINLEYRAFPFSWNRGGFDQRGAGNNGKFPDNIVNSDDRTFKFNQAITVGVGFTFPKPKTSE